MISDGHGVLFEKLLVVISPVGVIVGDRDPVVLPVRAWVDILVIACVLIGIKEPVVITIAIGIGANLHPVIAPVTAIKRLRAAIGPHGGIAGIAAI